MSPKLLNFCIALSLPFTATATEHPIHGSDGYAGVFLEGECVPVMENTLDRPHSRLVVSMLAARTGTYTRSLSRAAAASGATPQYRQTLGEQLQVPTVHQPALLAPPTVIEEHVYYAEEAKPPYPHHDQGGLSRTPR